MATIFKGEDYNTEFDPIVYLDTWYFSSNELLEDLNRFRFNVLTEAFTKGHFTGPRLLEIGGGPSIANIIYACKRFSEIVFSDYAEPCRQAIQKWVNDEPGSIDWSECIKNICNMDGSGEKWEEKQARARQSIKDIIHCDVLRPNPLEPKVYDPFDAVITSFVLEVACSDKESYKKALKAIAALIKPGGTLIMFGALNESYFFVGEKMFYCLKLDDEFIKAAVIECGFEITTFKVNRCINADLTLADFGGLLYLAAVKQN